MSKSLCVLIVCEACIDGVFTHVEGLIRYLIGTREARVHFAYSSVRGCPRSKKLVQEVESLGGNTIDLKVNNAPAFSDLQAYYKLIKFCHKNKPDITHAHSSKAGALVRLLPEKLSGAVFYTPHAYYGMDYNNTHKKYFFNLIERFLGTRGTSIHVSPEERAFSSSILRLSNQDSLLIPNAVNCSVFSPLESSSQILALKKSLRIPSSAFIFGSIARLGHQKNPQLLYQSFSLLHKHVDKSAGIYLLHLTSGTANELKELRELAVELEIDKHVIYPSYTSNPEIVYQVLDAFCLSSRYEGLPFTVLEALATDLPIVLTDVPGLKSFGNSRYNLSHIFYGDTCDKDSFFESMLACFESPKDNINHRNVAIEHFSINSVYGKILHAYQRKVH